MSEGTPVSSSRLQGCQLVKARPSPYVLAVIGVDRQGPEDPRVALRRIIGGVTVVAWALAGLSWLSSGSIDWTLVGFAGAMWGVYSFLTMIADTVGGLARFVGRPESVLEEARERQEDGEESRDGAHGDKMHGRLKCYHINYDANDAENVKK